MNKIPCNLIVYSSTKGHFGQPTLLETISSLNSQFPIDNFASAFIHIKISTGQDNVVTELEEKLHSLYHINVIKSYGDWRHGNDGKDNSHQIGYLNDMFKIYNMPEINNNNYSLIIEDDWLIKVYKNDFEYYINKAIKLLTTEENIVQIRIARFSDEKNRILRLKEKHNIDGIALETKDKEMILGNDWSNNCYIARTRDLRMALLLITKNQSAFPMHSEHGLGMAMAYQSWVKTPFMFFNPEFIRVGHIGVESPSDRDNLDQPLIST